MTVTTVALGPLSGCASTVPQRPVPTVGAQPALPSWYPQAPWTAKNNNQVFFEGKVIFRTAKSELRPESEAVLTQLLTWLKTNPAVSAVRLEGHTDARAGEEYNQSLSERRALAVANWLVDHGLAHTRIIAVAFGESRPVASNRSSEGRQENRRAAFRPAEVSGFPFRGEDPTAGGLLLTVLSKAEREALARVGEVPSAPEKKDVIERDVIKPVTDPVAPDSDDKD